MRRAASVEEIQDLVEKQIMGQVRSMSLRSISVTSIRVRLRAAPIPPITRFSAFIECNNREVKQENANKNPNRKQRPARLHGRRGFPKDIARRILLPREIVEAHEQGIIHFHDMDYFAQHMHNCDLVNLEDMLQNGTVITGTLIEKPHSFSTACNIATQIVAQVAK